MPEPRKPGLFLLVAVTLVVLLALYVGAYYAMVQVDVMEGYSAPFYQLASTTGSKFHLRIEPWFRPMHFLDRRIRPHVWEPTP